MPNPDRKSGKSDMPSTRVRLVGFLERSVQGGDKGMSKNVETAPARQGRWVRAHLNSNLWRCPECGHTVLILTKGENFCSHCGADMR